MSNLFDLPLDRPITELWLRGLLFFTFYLHLVFVLLMLGAAMLGLVYYIRGQFGPKPRGAEPDHAFLDWFFGFKGIAIVLGVAPILMMQVGNSIPFLTATNLVAPWWLWIIPLLIAALLLIEAVALRRRQRRWFYLVVALLGTASIMIIPGVLVALLVATENPAAWQYMCREGMFPSDLAHHWLARLMHVYGAAVVVTAAFHYLRMGPEHTAARKECKAWIVGGLVYQVVVGTWLYFSLVHTPGWLANTLVILGIILALSILWIVYQRDAESNPLPWTTLGPALLLLLLVMLLNRQVLQDVILVPVGEELAANKKAYAEEFPTTTAESVGDADARLVSYDNPVTIWFRSCEFCHGAVANGQGDEAPNLLIPPENVAAIRTDKPYFRKILAEGIPGTGMPYFGYYTAHEHDQLYEYLVNEVGMSLTTSPIDVEISQQARDEAARIFEASCSLCHGEDGQGTELSSHFEPPPPDFTRISWNAEWIRYTIANGYDSTQMRSFPAIDDETRWALAELVHGFYDKADPTAAVRLSATENADNDPSQPEPND